MKYTFSTPFGRCTVLFTVISLIHGNIGCKRLLEVEQPIESITSQAVYESPTTASAVLTGIYADMSNHSIFSGQPSITVSSGLSSDELGTVSTDPTDIKTAFYTNNLTTSDGGLWQTLYTYVFKVNSAIKGIGDSKALPGIIRDRLIGEAKFLRAFYYFHLVNFYGDVPLLTTTDIKANSNPHRTDARTVYGQIINDLKDAQELLPENYLAADLVNVSTLRVRPNRWAATAMLARVYLYTEQWSLAEAEASSLISQVSLFHLDDLNSVFLKASKEAIWQLQPVSNESMNTLDGLLFVLNKRAGQITAVGPSEFDRPYFMSKDLFNSFEDEDERKLKWVDSVTVGVTTWAFTFKYKKFGGNSEPVTEASEENLVMLRLAEQYLIRAEARAWKGNLTGPGSASEDLNVIRERAGLQDLEISDRTTMLNAILSERRHELFIENGHRWLDLKRTGKINERMIVAAPKKGGIWSSYKALFPIPVGDIAHNPNLKGKQNPGYPERL